MRRKKYTLEMREECGGQDTIHILSTPDSVESDAIEWLNDWVAEGEYGSDGCTVDAWYTVTRGNVVVCEGHIDVIIAPDVEECVRKAGGDPECDHDWRSAQSVVGGCTENPGVFGRGGGVIITEHCARCGVYRQRETMADDGHGGTTSRTRYLAPDDASMGYISRQ